MHAKLKSNCRIPTERSDDAAVAMFLFFMYFQFVWMNRSRLNTYAVKDENETKYSKR